MGVSYIKNKQNIYNWREANREQYNEYKRTQYDKLYQAKYRIYKKECNRLMAIDV